jgi:chemosensory pili system protein ChpA (sensor histidine kinase/response regulator)
MIVVVDDAPDAAEILVRLLTRTGFEAMAANCGEDLFTYLQATPAPPKLIILDLHMPRVDGLDCLRRMRGDERYRDLPVVMYSADFNHERMREAERLGVRDYVVKGTMRWADFLEIIHRYAN